MAGHEGGTGLGPVAQASEPDARVTRRAALVGASTAAASIPLLAGVDPVSAETPLPDSQIYGPGIDLLSGVVGRVYSPRTMFVVAQLPGNPQFVAVPVGVAPGAFVRGPASRSLTDFARGDEVLLGGRWHSRGLIAAAIDQVYRVVDGRITRRRHGRLEVGTAIVRLTDITRAVGDGAPHPDGSYANVAKPLRKLEPGDYITALGKRDGPTGDLIAFNVSTRKLVRRRRRRGRL